MIIIAACAFLITGCAGFQRESPSGTAGNTSERSTINNLLWSARESTYLVNTISYYTQYFLPEDNKLTKQDLENMDYRSQGWTKNITTQPASGTGILIGWQRENAIFITSAHLFDQADTILIPYDQKSRKGYQSVLIRTKHEIFLPDIFTEGNLEIISIDKKADICLLRGTVNPDNRKLHVFPFSLGNSRDLDWGSEVFIVGFPQGFHMITTGLVSKPFKFRPYEFALDAPFNKGMSGAPILFYDNKEKTLKLVGIGKSVSASTIPILVPEPGIGSDSTLVRSVYKDKIYTDEITIVNHGVSFTVPTNTIKDFLSENNEMVRNMGISLLELLGN